MVGTTRGQSSGFLNRVLQVRVLPGARCDVSGHRADMSRDIVPRSARCAVGLVVATRVQNQLTEQLSVLSTRCRALGATAWPVSGSVPRADPPMPSNWTCSSRDCPPLPRLHPAGPSPGAGNRLELERLASA
jgi:hypothetical protein